MSEEFPSEGVAVAQEAGGSAIESWTPLTLDDLHRVKLSVEFELGRSTLKVRDVLALRVGALVTLDKLAGEMTDIFVNGLYLARGEVVVMNDTLHVRISEVVGDREPSERDYV